MNLGSIQEEAAACRAAWAAKPRARYGAHIHHETPFEKLTEPIESRIAYILFSQPEAEQALRLRLLRPITAAAWAEYRRVKAAAWAEYRRVKAAAWAEYQQVTAAALAEYEQVTAAARAEYERVEAAAWAEYERIKAPARAEYNRVEAAAHKAACPTPGCPWDGTSIFGSAA